MVILENNDNSYETAFKRLEYIKDIVNAADNAVESAEGEIPPSLTRAISRIYTAASSAEYVLQYMKESKIKVEDFQEDDFSDDELASIYGGDTSQSQKDLARSELLSSMNALKIEVESGLYGISGLGAEGFNVTVVDDRNHPIYQHSYIYGWNASWNKRYASKKQPYVSDVIKSLCDKYTIPKENIFVYAGMNVFAGKPVRSDDVERFKTKYVDSIKLK